jgi:hypothetical protein
MILYEGPSLLDGKPIVTIATWNTDNKKTGDMVQTWIIRADVAPHDAVRTGADKSICGACPQRHYLGGACYVVPYQAPLSVYKHYRAGKYATARHVATGARKLRELPIRLGAYGDPSAVPFEVWEERIAQGCGTWTGYTHQWRTCDPRMKGIVMASVDSAAEERQARAAGWRTFRIVADGITSGGGTVECLSDARGMTCAACGICDGTRAGSRSPTAASVAIQVHGQRANRFKLNVLRG